MKILVALSIMALAARAAADIDYKSCGPTDFTRVRVGKCETEEGECKLHSSGRFLLGFDYVQAKRVERPIFRLEFEEGNVIEKRLGKKTTLIVPRDAGKLQCFFSYNKMPDFPVGKKLTLKLSIREEEASLDDVHACIEVPVEIKEAEPVTVNPFGDDSNLDDDE